MELSLNYGMRRYFINDNYLYVILFIVSFIFFLKQKQKKKMERKTPDSYLNYRGGDGDNSVVLQKTL